MRHRRRAEDHGAVLVEAVIVIGLFVVGFVAQQYFRDLYMHKLRVVRLARSAALAHAMGACTNDIRELAPEFRTRQNARSSPAVRLTEDIAPKPHATGGDKAGRALAGSNRSSHRRGTMFNDVTEMSFVDHASAATKPNPTAREWGFGAEVSSTSFVSCADPVTNETYGALADRIAHLFDH